MHLPATLSTERLTLRPFEMQDLAGYIAYFTGPRTGGVGGPKPRYVVIERFMAMIGQWALRGFGRYAIAQDGAAFGHAGVMQIDDINPPEMTWTLWDGTSEGQGFATEASRAIVEAWQGPALLARIAPDNTRSQRMAERLGFALDPDAVPPSYAPDFLTYTQGAA